MDECEVLYVDGNGNICVKCKACQKHCMIKAPKRKAIKIRCSLCGGVYRFKLEFRQFPRARFLESGTIGLREIHIYNISLGGICFKTNEASLEIGQKLKLSFPFEIKKGDIEEAILTVEIVSLSNGKYGARFLDLLDESRLKQAIYRKTYK